MSRSIKEWFKVINTTTGKEVDSLEVTNEAWSKGIYPSCTVSWAISEVGELLLVDSCGHIVRAPESYVFKITGSPEQDWI